MPYNLCPKAGVRNQQQCHCIASWAICLSLVPLPHALLHLLNCSFEFTLVLSSSSPLHHHYRLSYHLHFVYIATSDLPRAQCPSQRCLGSTSDLVEPLSMGLDCGDGILMGFLGCYFSHYTLSTTAKSHKYYLLLW